MSKKTSKSDQKPAGKSLMEKLEAEGRKMIQERMERVEKEAQEMEQELSYRPSAAE